MHCYVNHTCQQEWCSGCCCNWRARYLTGQPHANSKLPFSLQLRVVIPFHLFIPGVPMHQLRQETHSIGYFTWTGEGRRCTWSPTGCPEVLAHHVEKVLWHRNLHTFDQFSVSRIQPNSYLICVFLGKEKNLLQSLLI